MNGTKQLIEVMPSIAIPRRFRRRCRICARRARSAKAATRRQSSTARSCWSSPALPTMNKNTETQTVLVLHLGGEDSLSHLTGIHGVHLGHIEYIATDPTRTTIPWVQRRNADGIEDRFAASTLKGAVPQGERRVMDCIDCHNRAAHTFVTAEEALNRAMADGAISPRLPWVHKEGLGTAQGRLHSQDEARAEDSRRSLKPSIAMSILRCSPPRPDLVKAAGEGLVTLYTRMFP